MLLSAITPIINFDYFAELGYDAIDVSFCGTIYTKENNGIDHDDIVDGDDHLKKLEVYKEKCLKTGVKINTTHIPYRYDYANFSDPNYEYHFEMTRRCFEASEYLGAKWTVVHFHDDGIEPTVNHIKKLYGTTNVKTLGVAIENLPYIPIEPVIEACEILKKEGYNVGICLDTGHCHANSTDSRDVGEYIRIIGEHLKMLHVHDNCGNGDFHLEPYAGTIKWDEVMKALREIDFKGDLNFELRFTRIPDKLRLTYDKYCLEVGRYLISLFEEEEQ